jgi:hypothetical protein
MLLEKGRLRKERKGMTKRLPKKGRKKGKGKIVEREGKEKGRWGEGGKGKRMMDGPEVGPFLACRGNKDGIFIPT